MAEQMFPNMFLDHKQALAYLNVSESTLRRYRNQGLIDSYRMGGLRFTVKDLDNLREKCRIEKRKEVNNGKHL